MSEFFLAVVVLSSQLVVFHVNLPVKLPYPKVWYTILPDNIISKFSYQYTNNVFFQVGIVYVFNLIVGTGALTLPKAMASAGWLISIILLIVLCIMR